MCPVILFGSATAAAGTAGYTGLIGAGGAFAAAQAVPTALSLLGAGMSAYGQAYQGAVQAANYEYQAGMMQYNKKISENNALMARRASEFDADTFDLDKRRMLARQRTGYAKSGVVIDQDTPLDVSAETAAEAQLERLAILYKGETQAEAYLQQATGQEAAAARYRLNAQMAGTSGAIGAATELAKGAYTQFRYSPRGAGTSLLGD
tara:strand:- start:365 stop:982 length:618 start_codon:yes stop_codon:yes gene_type:complete